MRKRIILMGDIINSSKQPPSKLSHQFNKIIKITNQKFKSVLLTREFTITLGDEFQGIVQDFKSAVEIMTFIDEEIIKSNFQFRLRYSLFFGEVQNQINKENAWGMLGSGLVECRNILNKMKKNTVFEINGFDNFYKESKLVAKLLRSKRSIQEKWNEKDFGIIVPYLNQNSVENISIMENKTKQQIKKRIHSLNLEIYDNLSEVINFLSEQVIKKWGHS